MNNTIPLVSICCTTYNHLNYIRQCLDGFVMQKTNFPIEILIHDDASTDGTQDIIREYEAKYPNIIKPIYQKENQYSKGVKVNLVYNYSRVKGKYIALCEGDDYWTDPHKLQKQVDFLESHPDYVMCSHRFNQYIQDKGILEEEKDFTFQGTDYDLKNLIIGKWITQTLTVMFRYSILDLNLLRLYGISQDFVLCYALLKNGKGYCFSDIMGVYRVHNGGVWTGISLNNQRKMEFEQRLAIYDVEKSEVAALSLLSLFARAMSRIWICKQWKMFLKSLNILKRHYGALFSFNLMFNRLILNRGLNWNKVLELSKNKE